LGACLGECPRGAISVEEREAADFDETAVRKHLIRLNQSSCPGQAVSVLPQAKEPGLSDRGCPGSAMQCFEAPGTAGVASINQSVIPSQLGHWPVQLMLVSPRAPFIKNADLLICADCVPFAIPDFHFRYLTGKAVVVGCPKLDDLRHYSEKLKSIFKEASPRSITILKMEVPCCHGLAQAAVQARNETAQEVPVEVHTIGIRGDIECQIPPQAK